MTSFRVRLGWLALGLCSALSSACGVGPVVDLGTASGTPEPSAYDRGPPPDWESPVVGQQVDSIESARPFLAFQPRDPRGLGEPLKLFVSGNGSLNASAEEEAGRVLALVYDSRDYGRVVVIEQLLQETVVEFEASLEGVVAAAKQPGTHGTASIRLIRSGVVALITTDESGSTSDIRWAEAGIIFLAKGPSLSQDAAIQMAEQL